MLYRSFYWLKQSLLLTLLTFICYSGVYSQDLPAELYVTTDTFSSAKSQARALIDSLMIDQNIPGLQVAVSIDGELVWSEGMGWADLEHGVPLWPNTKMRIGSVSKSLTSAGLGLLIDRGQLNLTEEVQTYVPIFPVKKYPITVRQIASHQAGIRHYEGDEFSSRDFYATVGEGLEIFMYDSLLFEPGTSYSYSSYGWNLISAVIEGASGRSFLEFMRNDILDPLEMHDTVADNHFAIIPHRSGFYDLSGQGSVINAVSVDNSYKWAGGGYLSTAEDLIRFGNSIMEREFLSTETVAALWRPIPTLDGDQTNYGLGWQSGATGSGYRWVGHSGGSMGAQSQFLVLPTEEVVIAMNINSGAASFGGIHLRIADLFIQQQELSDTEN